MDWVDVDFLGCKGQPAGKQHFGDGCVGSFYNFISQLSSGNNS